MDLIEVTLRNGHRTIRADLIGPEEGWPLLFFHGSPGCRLQAERLAAAAEGRGARLIALDRPGCGGTSPAVSDYARTVADDVSLTLDHLGLQSAPALAVSGGMAAVLVTASRLGGQVTSIRVASGLGLLTSAELRCGTSVINRFLFVVARRGSFSARLALIPPFLMSRLSAVVMPDARDQRLRALQSEVRETFAFGAWGPAADLSMSSRVDRLDLSAVRQPLVAWHGSRDRYAPLAAVRALVDRLPNASLRVVEDGDHFIFESHADAILASLAPTDS